MGEQYKLIGGADPAEIEKQVQQHLDEGWTTVGELKPFTFRDCRGFTSFVQQMSKNKPN